MKTGKVLSVLGILVLAGVVIFGITGSVCAQQNQIDKHKEKDAADTTAAKQVEDSLPQAGVVDPNGTGQDKGSPMHAWLALVDANKKKGDRITRKEFAGMRNWSASTRGYELQSLVAIGVLAPTGRKGEYELKVDATPEEIGAIDVQLKPIVGRTSRDGTPLGLGSYRLDAAYLGGVKASDSDAVAAEGIKKGTNKLEQIRKVISGVTNSPISVAKLVPTWSINFVQVDMDNGTVPASVAINGDTPFTITEDGKEIDLELLSSIIPEEAGRLNLLAGLVDTRILHPEAEIIVSDRDGAQYSNFQAATVRTVLFEEGFVTGSPEEFKKAFAGLKTDETAVIIAIAKTNEEIRAALETAGLLGEWGNRIVVMGVAADSLAAKAFGRLFADESPYSLRGRKVDTILKNRDLVIGLAGGV